MDALYEFANKIAGFLLNFINILPDSPFSTYFEFIDELNILGHINYFIPFDIALNIMNLWLVAITSYYLYNFVKGTLTSKNSLIGKIFDYFI